MNNNLSDEKVVQYVMEDALKANSPYANETVTGELRYGKEENILSGTLSTRTDIKKLNFNTQNLLEHKVEPLFAMEYIIAGKKSILNYVKNIDKNSFDIMTIPTMPQFRTIRRIVGKCDFNAIDGQMFSDSIGSCGDFRPENIGKHYQIPLGAFPHGDGW